MADLVINDIITNSLSGSSISATTANVSDIFAANTTISNTLYSPIFSGLTLYSGATNIENVFTLSGDNRLSISNEIRVKKNPGYGEYLTINEALSSITTNSITNRFRVYVGPGIFVEDTILLKPYVEVRGSGSETTVIKVDSPSKNVVIGTDNAVISDVFITGATDSGSIGIYYSSNTVASFYVENVTFGGNNILMKVVGSGSGNCIALCTNIKYGDGYFFDKGFIATNDGSGVGRIFLKSSTTLGKLFETVPSIFAITDAPDCQIVLNSVQIRNGGTTGGIGIQAENGGVLRLTSVNINGFDKAVYMPNVGVAPSIRALAMNFENNNKDVVIEHTSATGKVGFPDDINKLFINDSCSVFIPYKDSHIITVAKKGGDFTSIASAVTFITGATSVNPYEVLVGPGVFVEPEIFIPSFISVVGSSIQSTIVVPDGDHHIFHLQNPFVELSFMNLSGSSVGKAGIFVDDAGIYTQAHKLTFNDCDIGIFVQSSTQSTEFYGEYVDYNGAYSYGTKIEATNNVELFANFENYYNFPTEVNGAFPYGSYASGSGATFNALTSANLGISSGGTAFCIQDSARMELLSVETEHWNVGIHVINSGLSPTLIVDSAVIEDSGTNSLLIEHPNTLGSFQGALDFNKLSISASTNFSLLAQDFETGESLFSKKINIRFNEDVTTDISTLLIESSTMGVMEWGGMSGGTGFTVNISNGFGYLEIEPEILKKVTWSAVTLTLSANTSNYLYFDENEILQTSSIFPDTFSNILLGRVITNSNSIQFVDRSPLEAEHSSNRDDLFFRNALGSVFDEGSIVSENGVRQLDVTGGHYYFSHNHFQPLGGTAITFNTFYRDGSGGFIHSSSTVIDNTYYDDNSGVLVPLSGSYYTKHSLYLGGDNEEEKYFLVYGQNQYSALTIAEQVSLPIPPTFFIDGIVPIASIIVQEGFSGITEIRDERPVIGFKSSGIAASSSHGNLLGLSNDDHLQYLLVSGTRSMSGNLNLGDNNITNTNNIQATSLSAISISATTFYSGSTNLSNIFVTPNQLTRVQNGLNTYTGGTSTFPTVNISAATLDNVTVSGNTSLNILSANTVSGGTIYSGSTNIGVIFATTAVTASLQSQINTKSNRSGDTFTGNIFTPGLSANTISATTYYQDTQEVRGTIFNSSAPTGIYTGNTWVRTSDYEMFVFDGVRNNWLSPNNVVVGGSRNAGNATDIFLRHYDGTPWNNDGFLLPYDMTLVGITAKGSAAQTWKAVITTGTTLGTNDIASLQVTSSSSASDMNYNVLLTSGQTIYIAMSGSSISYPIVHAYFKRRGN